MERHVETSASPYRRRLNKLPAARCLLPAILLPAFLLLLAASVAHGGEIEVIRNVAYADDGEPRHVADVYLPEGQGPFPGVLVVHGGAWMMGDKSHLGWVARRLAEQGFAAVSINYRLAPQHKFPAQLEDCQAALTWMLASAGKYRIDADRLAGYGYSAGGHLVTLLAMKNSQPPEPTKSAAGKDSARLKATCLKATCLKAVVAGGTPCDFRWIPPDQPALAYWLGGTRAECPEAYESASPLCYVGAGNPPILFFHGENDQLVDKRYPTEMSAQLKKLGVASEVLLLPGKEHIMAMFDASAVEAGVAFLRKHVVAQTAK